MIKTIPDEFWPWLRGEESESQEHEKAMLQAYDDFKHNLWLAIHVLPAMNAYLLDFD